MMGVEGRLQREDKVIHVVAERVYNYDPLLGGLAPDVHPRRAADEAKFDIQSRDFH